MKRKLDDWLTAYLEYTENTESHLSYRIWTGIGVLSGALRRQVWINWPDPIYPNQYIVLVGPSSQSRKSQAINPGKALLRELTVPVLPDDNTPESIIQYLESKCQDTFYYDGRQFISTTATAFCTELSVFTGNKNTRFLVYLTDWYDSASRWERQTKHQGFDELVGLCFNLVGATADRWFPYILTEEAIGGGFTSRCIFIVEQDRGKIIADPNLHNPPATLKEALTHDLEIISMIIGEMKFDKAAYDRYTSWYLHTAEEEGKGHWAVRDPLFRGYCARRATHIKKLAIAISVSESDDLVITLDQFERAMGLMVAAEENMGNLFSSFGTASYVGQTTEVMNFIRSNGKVSKSEIMRQFYRSVDSTILEAVIKVLTDMKRVRVDISSGEVIYQYVEDT